MARSRDWICVRLATYENKAEGAFLESLFRGRSGVLENTTFALLGPDGKTRLSRTGRGPDFLLASGRGRGRGRGKPQGGGTPQAFAQLLAEAAQRYRPKAQAAALPQSLDFRRALNVSACDNQPLVVIHALKEKDRAALEKTVAGLAWSKKYVGRMQYAVVSDAAELTSLKGLRASSGLSVVQPGRFGLTGEVLVSCPVSASRQMVAAALAKGLARFRLQEKDTRTQVRAGRSAGIAWESEIPVTDPGRGR